MTTAYIHVFERDNRANDWRGREIKQYRAEIEGSISNCVAEIGKGDFVVHEIGSSGRIKFDKYPNIDPIAPGQTRDVILPRCVVEIDHQPGYSLSHRPIN